jgi:hypothetical protein
VQSIAARSTAKRWEGKSRVGGGFLGDVRSRDKGANPCGAVMTSGHREQGSARDQATIPGGQNGNGLLTSGPGPVKYIFKFPNPTETKSATGNQIAQ